MKKVGIVKGGQLGRMFIQAGIGQGISAYVMDPDPNAPCRTLCEGFVCADPMDERALVAFGRSVDVLTFEFERVSIAAIEKLEAEGRQVFPGSKAMRAGADKGIQKELFLWHGIPTSDFVLIRGRADREKVEGLLPCLQKTRTAGYDGKGVQSFDTKDDLHRMWDVPSVIERRVEFERELSIIVARDRFGKAATYPPVETIARKDGHLLDRLVCPARVSAQTADKAQGIARRIAEVLDLVGVMAVEMFVTRPGEVLVNEIAPRPHNSGHHTIETHETSQYAQHLRCVTGLPLGSTRLVRPSVMINILGEPGFSGSALYRGLEEVMGVEGVHVHLYGKKLTHPLRKMGHVTVTAEDIEAAEEKARWVRSRIRVVA